MTRIKKGTPVRKQTTLQKNKKLEDGSKWEKSRFFGLLLGHSPVFGIFICLPNDVLSNDCRMRAWQTINSGSLGFNVGMGVNAFECVLVLLKISNRVPFLVVFSFHLYTCI
jgi:hypothetical protein